VPDGVRVVFVFERPERVWTVRIRPRPGAPAVPATDLMEHAVRLRRDSRVDAAAIEADRARIVRYLRRSGYHFATADPRTRPVEARPGFWDVTFHVDRGPKVQPERVTLIGHRAVPEKRLRARMRTRPDTWLTSRRFVERTFLADLERLRSYYIGRGWENARVRARPVLFDPQPVRITVRHAGPSNAITRLRVHGAEAVSERVIRRHFLTRPGRTFRRAVFDRDLAWLRARYYRAGYRAHPEDIVIRKRTLPSGAGEVAARLLFARARETVAIDVTVGRDPAGRAVVQGVRHRTSGPFTNRQIADRCSLRPGAPFTRDDLTRDVWAVVRFYTRPDPEHRYGLLGITYGPAGRRVQIRFVKRGPGTDSVAAHLRVLIDEGDRHTVGTVTFRGVEPLIEAHLRDRLRLKPRGPFTRDDWNADLRTIRTVFEEQGYADVRIAPTRVARRGERVFDLRYAVTPGPVYHVNLIRPRGNDRTKPVVIEREMAIRPGDRFDVRKINESVRRLRNLGYFDRVEWDAADSRKVEPGRRFKDLVIRVQEARTRRTLIGVGASSSAGVFGNLQFTDRNFDISDTPRSWDEFVSGTAFAGAGQTLALFLMPGTETSRFGVRWADPWFGGEPVEMDIGADYARTEWHEFSLDQVGGRVSVGRRFRPDLTGFVAARAYGADLRHVDTNAPTDVWDDEGEHRILGLGVGLRGDTRDDRLLPTRGARWEVMAELIGDPGVDALKLAAEGRWYHTLYEAPDKSRHVLALRGDLALLTGSDLPVFERLYAGGLGSIRGFARHGISPQGTRTYVNPNNKALGTAPINGDPIGGELRVEGSVEYHIPIIKDRLRGVVFLDAGSVADRSLGFGDIVSDLRVSAGAGVEFVLPYLGRIPLALYVGVPLKKESGDDTEAITFSFGFILH